MPHIHKEIDFAVGVFIVHRNKVLLVFHKALQLWLPVGGHIELNETPEQALFREAKEESGLDIELIGEKPEAQAEGRKFLYAPRYMDFHPIKDGHFHVGLVYFARADTDTVQLAEQAHDEIRWFTREELADPEKSVDPDVQFLAREALSVAQTE